jgi:hypothetical protein
MTSDKRRQTGGRVGGSNFPENQPSNTPEKTETRAIGGYQPTRSNPPEKRTPPKGGSNVTPPPA